jgi:hypothetical protein
MIAPVIPVLTDAELEKIIEAADNDPRWGLGRRGEGQYADLLAQRFAAACARYGFKHRERFVHNSAVFVAGSTATSGESRQMSLL